MARKRVKNGFVLCSTCDNPASRSLTELYGESRCALCVYGEADALVKQMEEGDTIPEEVLHAAD